MSLYVYLYDKGNFRGGRVSTKSKVDSFLFSEIKKIKSFEDFKDILEMSMDGIFFDQQNKKNTFIYDLTSSIYDSDISSFMKFTGVGPNIHFVEAYAQVNNLDVSVSEDFEQVISYFSNLSNQQFLQLAIDLNFISFKDVWDYFKSYWDNYYSNFNSNDSVIFIYRGSTTSSEKLKISNIVGLKEIKDGDIITNNPDYVSLLESSFNTSKVDRLLESFEDLQQRFFTNLHRELISEFDKAYDILKADKKVKFTYKDETFLLVSVFGKILLSEDLKSFKVLGSTSDSLYSYMFDTYFEPLIIPYEDEELTDMGLTQLKQNLSKSIDVEKIYSTDILIINLDEQKLFKSMKSLGVPARVASKFFFDNFKLEV